MGGGCKGGQKVIKEGSDTTEEGMSGQNKSTEGRAIGIRGEGDGRRVDFYRKNKQTAFVVIVVMCMTTTWCLLQALCL